MTRNQERGSLMVDSAAPGRPHGELRRHRARRLGTTSLAALAALGLLAAGCKTQRAEDAAPTPTSQYANETASDADPVLGGRLIYGVPAETSSFNPMLATWASYSLTIARTIYDTLATYDADGVPVPDLAESIEPNADYTAWTVKLRPGVTYVNGKPLNAAAVVAMQRAYKASPVVGVVYGRVADWEIKDDLTFVAKMNRAWPGYLNAMASQVGVVADPDWLTSDDATHPIGTGPFIVESWDVNNEMVLRKNPNYWRKDAKGTRFPYLSGVTFKVITEEGTRTEALRNGDIDIMMQNYATPNVASLIEQARAGNFQAFDDKLFEGPEDYVLVNHAKAPFNDVDARKALAQSLDIDDYIQSVTGGLDTPADSPWKPGSKWYTPVNYPKYDAAEASRLVQAVKARNGGKFTVKLLGQQSTESTRVQQWLQEQWTKAGIEVSLDVVPQQTKIIKMLQGDYDLVLTQQFDNPLPSSENVYWMNFHQPPGSLSIAFSRITDPEIDRLSDDAWSVTGEAETADYNAIAKRLAENVDFVWLGHASRTVVAKSSVVNIVRASLPGGETTLEFIQGSHPLHQVWLKR
jgi:peptide/nickel transport system substrate-binding protein